MFVLKRNSMFRIIIKIINKKDLSVPLYTIFLYCIPYYVNFILLYTLWRNFCCNIAIVNNIIRGGSACIYGQVRFTLKKWYTNTKKTFLRPLLKYYFTYHEQCVKLRFTHKGLKLTNHIAYILNRVISDSIFK